MAKTRQLSIYLIKPGVDVASAIKPGSTPSEVNIQAYPDFVAGLMIRSTDPHPPGWVSFFPQDNQGDLAALRAASSGAVLFVKARERLFAVCFGTGWHLLDGSAFVRNFGLRACLSLVKPKTLKSVDFNSYDTVAKYKRISASQGTTIDALDFEGQLDLLRGAVGECVTPALGVEVGGKDPCVLWTKLEFASLERVCKVLLAAYDSKRVSRRFPVIEQIYEVRDQSEVDKLFNLLDLHLARDKTIDISIAPPEAVDWFEVASLTLDLGAGAVPSPLLSFPVIRSIWAPRPPTKALMSSVYIGTETPNGTPGNQRWPLVECLVTEISDPDEPDSRFILMAGNWYRIASDYVQQVNTELQTIRHHHSQMPDAYPDEAEASYNERFYKADKQGRTLLDAKSISYGGGYSKIEVCDVISSKKVLYHIKAYGKSSTLSHLWSQGAVSCRLLLEEGFRKEVLAKFPNITGSVIKASSLTANEFEVVFGIICESERSLPDGLPFFSKVRLLETRRELRRMGFTNVTLAKIARLPTAID